MKKLFLFVFYFFLFHNSSYGELTTPEIVKKYADSVVLIGTVMDSKLTGFGSGVIIDKKGYIVTNYHVIKRAANESIVIKNKNGENYTDIKILDVDKRRDFAVLKIKGFDLTTADLGNSNKIDVGMKIIAIGNPKGLENTVSEGIVSAKREMDGYWLIQVTAPISPGSSGGGLFNTNGELVGITTATVKDGQNLNFAIPINYVRGSLEEILINPEKYYSASKSLTVDTIDNLTTESVNEQDPEALKKQVQKLTELLFEVAKIYDLFHSSSYRTLIKQREKDFWTGRYKNPQYIDQGIFIASEKSKEILQSLKKIVIRDNKLYEIYSDIKDSVLRYNEALDKLINRDYQVAMAKYPMAEEFLMKAGDKMRNLVMSSYADLADKLPPFARYIIPQEKIKVRFGVIFALSVDKVVLLAISKNSPAENELEQDDMILGYYSDKNEKIFFKDRSEFYNWLTQIQPDVNQTLIIQRKSEVLNIDIKPTAKNIHRGQMK